MKKILNIWAVAFLFIAEGLWAQTYHFYATSEPYVDLTGGTAAIQGIWDDPQFTVPIGFTFNFFDEPITDLVLNSNFSYILLADRDYADTMAFMGLYGEDLIDRGFGIGTSQSPITYKTTGTAGHRVLTVEWQNAGFYREYQANGVSADYVNFQLKLEEETGDIIFHYGPSSVQDPALAYEFGGPFVGIFESLLFPDDVSLGEVVLLSGDPANPDLHYDYNFTYLNGTIPPNTAYRFSKQVSAVQDPIVISDLPYFGPNPSSGDLFLNSQYIYKVLPPVQIFNRMGELALTSDQTGHLDLSDFSSGIYQLIFNTPHGRATQRIALLH